MMAYHYANIRKCLHGIAFQGRLAYAVKSRRIYRSGENPFIASDRDFAGPARPSIQNPENLFQLFRNVHHHRS